MAIRQAILGFLSWRPATGYELKKLFAESAFLHWSGNNHQIYRTLIELHREGLVSLEVEPQESLPARKKYSVTARGRDELRRWLLSDPELPERRSAFLVQFAWADLLTPAELGALLDKYEHELEMQLLMCREQARRGALNPARTPRERYLWERVSENWIQSWETELAWLRSTRQGLSKLKARPRKEGAR
jgi:DNA-binding PadR family transcriptional regulator